MSLVRQVNSGCDSQLDTPNACHRLKPSHCREQYMTHQKWIIQSDAEHSDFHKCRLIRDAFREYYPHKRFVQTHYRLFHTNEYQVLPTAEAFLKQVGSAIHDDLNPVEAQF